MIVKMLAVMCLGLLVYYLIYDVMDTSEKFKENHPDSKEGCDSEEHY